jgi:hypothetical protein
MARIITTVTVGADCGHPHKVAVIDRAQLRRLLEDGSRTCGAPVCNERWHRVLAAAPPLRFTPLLVGGRAHQVTRR